MSAATPEPPSLSRDDELATLAEGEQRWARRSELRERNRGIVLEEQPNNPGYLVAEHEAHVRRPCRRPNCNPVSFFRGRSHNASATFGCGSSRAQISSQPVAFAHPPGHEAREKGSVRRATEHAAHIWPFSGHRLYEGGNSSAGNATGVLGPYRRAVQTRQQRPLSILQSSPRLVPPRKPSIWLNIGECVRSSVRAGTPAATAHAFAIGGVCVLILRALGAL